MKLGQLYVYASIYGERFNSYMLATKEYPAFDGNGTHYVMYDLLCNVCFNTRSVGSQWTLIN